MLEDRFAQHDKEVVDKYINPAADVQMAVWDYVIRPSANADSGPWTLTLPPVAEAKGRFYSIICRNADPVNSVTIADDDDSECWRGDIVLNGKCDGGLFYSDGLAWITIRPPGGWNDLVTTPPPGTLAPTTIAPTTASPEQ
jgi:hypothetical protein